MSALVQASGSEGFEAPSSRDFELPAYFGDSIVFTKPTLLLVLSIVMISAFFSSLHAAANWCPASCSSPARRSTASSATASSRDVIGQGLPEVRAVPDDAVRVHLVVNNVFGIIPGVQFPTMSHIGFPIVLALVLLGDLQLRRHQAATASTGYFKHDDVPAGVPRPVYILLAPIEFVSTVLVRPVTLAVRLFANMFAGHLLLLVFMLGAEYMLLNESALPRTSSAPFAAVMAIVLTFFEALDPGPAGLRLHAADRLYIAGALADEH